MMNAHGQIRVINEERESEREENDDNDILSLEEVEEFFLAVEDGSVQRLEQLFDEKLKANPNMTRFTESLLMAAIRNERNEVADYLIDQLAINVQYTADLHEFRLRNRIPIRYRMYSCRDLAYEKGMMELVDLIDLTNPSVTSNIKSYLKSRLKTRLNRIHEAYLKRLEDSTKQVRIENENHQLPPVNSVSSFNKNTLQTSAIMSRRQRKSFIDETIENIDTSKEKSIDETGKKTFRFSNYTLRFRLMENFEPQPKLPSLPTISLFTSPSTPLITSNQTHRSISETSSHLSFRPLTRTTTCATPRHTILPSITPTNARSSSLTTTTTKRKQTKHQSFNYGYIPRAQETLYNQPKRYMPVTLKATAIGLPSDTRVIRE